MAPLENTIARHILWRMDVCALQLEKPQKNAFFNDPIIKMWAEVHAKKKLIIFEWYYHFALEGNLLVVWPLSNIVFGAGQYKHCMHAALFLRSIQTKQKCYNKKMLQYYWLTHPTIPCWIIQNYVNIGILCIQYW